MSQFLRLALLLALLPFLNASSCSTSDRSDRGDDYPRDPYPSNGGGYDDHSSYGLPENAALVREGKGERLEFESTKVGDYFVYYPKDRRIIKSGRIYGGDRVVVDPDKNRIYVEGKTVYDSDLKSDRIYRIYFARADGRPYNEGGGGGGGFDPRPDHPDRPDNRPPPSTGAKVPKNAEVVTSGRGKLEFTAKYTGQFFVYDDRFDVVVQDGQIDKGQRLLVDPERGRITVDKRVALERGLKSDSSHKVYFLKSSR